MKGGYARRSTPGFVFYGLFLVVFAAESSPGLPEGGRPDANRGPDGIGV